MSDKIIAQCMDCGHKHELVEHFSPGTVKCSECEGPLTQYTSRQLSPEELAKYGPAVPNKKPQFTRDAIKHEKQITPKPIKEELSMTTQPISREEYLIRRSKGEKRTAIFDSLGLGTTQYYKLLTEWGIKDTKTEQRYIDLIPARKDQPTGLDAINEAHHEEMVKIDPPVTNVEEPAVVQEDPIKEESVIVQPEVEPEAAAPDIAQTAPVLTIADPIIATIEQVPQRKSKRSMQIESTGNNSTIEEELLALLSYMQAMNGKSFSLELSLVEIV